MIELAQVERMVGRRHARGVGIPEQQVEGEGLLAQQVVVDDERPDQVVGAQHVEHGRHLRSVQIAPLGHHFFQRLQLCVIDEHQEVAGAGEVDLGGEEGRRGDAFVVMLHHVGHRRGEQGAARRNSQACSRWIRLSPSRLDRRR